MTADDSRRRGGAQQIPRPIAFSTSEVVPWPADSVWTMDSLVAAVSADVAPVLPLFPGSRLSAVLVLLAPGAEGPEVLLTRRSMNLTNHEKTPVFRVFEIVKREAARYGVAVLESEIVGLVPSAALLAAAQWYLQLDGFTADQVLEHRLRTTAGTP